MKKEKTSVILGKCIYNHMPLKFHKQASTAILIALLVPVCRIYMLNKPWTYQSRWFLSPPLWFFFCILRIISCYWANFFDEIKTFWISISSQKEGLCRKQKIIKIGCMDPDIIAHLDHFELIITLKLQTPYFIDL